MDIGKLFSGIAVIIDDEINNEKSQISSIRKLIEQKNIPVAVYDDVPKLEIIPSLASASFVILDWEYKKNPIEDGERVMFGGSTLVETQEDNLISFIKNLLDTVFLPVFIFTYNSPETVIENLIAANLWQTDRPNRIFIKRKNEVSTGDQLFDAIENWVREMPSVYVLKEWEKSVSETKSRMFLEMYKYSPNWSKIMWDMLKEDSIESKREFGDFVTRNLFNRVEGYDFDTSILDAGQTITPQELQEVVQGERYLSYVTLPAQAYTGDLFKDGQRYYLNIRAQCDLARANSNGTYDPILYCIKGEKLKCTDITTDEIKMTSDGNLEFSANKRFSLDDIRDICKDGKRLPELNQHFVKHRNRVFFRKGTLIERNDKVILGCVAGEQAIQFKLDIELKSFNTIKDKRIGRVLPPYITQVQQKCSQNMIREGVMPLPKELFYNFEG